VIVLGEHEERQPAKDRCRWFRDGRGECGGGTRVG